MLSDSQTNESSFNSNKYNLRIFNSEKIGVDEHEKLLKAIALTTFFCRRYIGFACILHVLVLQN